MGDRIFVPAGYGIENRYLYPGKGAFINRKGKGKEHDFAKKLLAALQKGLEKCLELELRELRLRKGSPILLGYVVVVKQDLTASAECKDDCKNSAERLKYAITTKHDIRVYNSKIKANAYAGFHRIDVNRDFTNVYLDEDANINLPAKTGEKIEIGFESFAWHEIVGHGAERAKWLRDNKVEWNHPRPTRWLDKSGKVFKEKNMWNLQGNRDFTHTDPIIDIENERRRTLGLKERLPHYFTRILYIQGKNSWTVRESDATP